jgi:hypothetical protein
MAASEETGLSELQRKLRQQRATANCKVHTPEGVCEDYLSPTGAAAEASGSQARPSFRPKSCDERAVCASATPKTMRRFSGRSDEDLSKILKERKRKAEGRSAVDQVTSAAASVVRGSPSARTATPCKSADRTVGEEAAGGKADADAAGAADLNSEGDQVAFSASSEAVVRGSPPARETRGWRKSNGGKGYCSPDNELTVKLERRLELNKQAEEAAAARMAVVRPKEVEEEAVRKKVEEAEAARKEAEKAAAAAAQKAEEEEAARKKAEEAAAAAFAEKTAAEKRVRELEEELVHVKETAERKAAEAQEEDAAKKKMDEAEKTRKESEARALKAVPAAVASLQHQNQAQAELAKATKKRQEQEAATMDAKEAKAAEVAAQEKYVLAEAEAHNLRGHLSDQFQYALVEAEAHNWRGQLIDQFQKVLILYQELEKLEAMNEKLKLENQTR